MIVASSCCCDPSICEEFCCADELDFEDLPLELTAVVTEDGCSFDPSNPRLNCFGTYNLTRASFHPDVCFSYSGIGPTHPDIHTGFLVCGAGNTTDSGGPFRTPPRFVVTPVSGIGGGGFDPCRCGPIGAELTVLSCRPFHAFARVGTVGAGFTIEITE